MSTNANMQREMCLRGPGAGGIREEEEEQSRSREWRTAETLVTASQSSHTQMGYYLPFFKRVFPFEQTELGPIISVGKL